MKHEELMNKEKTRSQSNAILAKWDALKSSVVHARVDASAVSDLVQAMSRELGDVSVRVFAQLDDLTNTTSRMPSTHKAYSRLADNIAHLVSERIVHTSELPVRAVEMEFWLAVMKDRLEKGDFNTAFAIREGLHDASVERLKNTKRNLSGNAKAVLQYMDAIFDRYGHVYEVLNYVKENAPQLTIVPLFDIYKQLIKAVNDNITKFKLDLQQVEVGSPTYQHLKKQIRKEESKLHAYIDQVSDYQAALVRDFPDIDTKALSELQSKLLKINLSSSAREDLREELRYISMMREGHQAPKVFTHILDGEKGRAFIPYRHVNLTLPEHYNRVVTEAVKPTAKRKQSFFIADEASKKHKTPHRVEKEHDKALSHQPKKSR